MGILHARVSPGVTDHHDLVLESGLDAFSRIHNALLEILIAEAAGISHFQFFSRFVQKKYRTALDAKGIDNTLGQQLQALLNGKGLADCFAKLLKDTYPYFSTIRFEMLADCFF